MHSEFIRLSPLRASEQRASVLSSAGPRLHVRRDEKYGCHLLGALTLLRVSGLDHIGHTLRIDLSLKSLGMR